MKKIIYVLIAIGIVGITAYRITEIARESSRPIYNVARAAQTDGMPIETMVAKVMDGALREPLVVKNGKAFVSGARVRRFRIGQKIVRDSDVILPPEALAKGGGGHVTSVARNIDLDTGLFAVKTSSPDGNVFAEIQHTGIFLPLSAVSDSTVMIVQDGIATEAPIKIIARDADQAVVSGLSDGDIVILTKVDAGIKIKIVTRDR